MASRGFKVAERALPSGNVSWRVTGTLNGRQVRRQFLTRAEAEKFRDSQDAILFGREPNKVPVRTHLSNREVQEAEAVFASFRQRFPGKSLFDAAGFFEALGPVVGADDPRALASSLRRLRERHPDQPLASAIDFYAENYRAPVSAILLHEALKEYLEDRVREADSRSLSERQFESIGHELQRFEKHFGGERPLSGITHLDLAEYLQVTFPRDKAGQAAYSNKSWNNRRGYLTTFFGFCVQRGWLEDNSAQRVRVFKRSQLPHREVEILSAEKCTKLMAFLEGFAEGRLVPFFALCLFAGIRPDWQDGEISKLRPEDLRWEEGYIRLGRDKTKTKRKRHTVIQPNLRRWLKAYPLAKYPIICVNFRKLLYRTRRQFDLGHDVLRHTYCSMLVGRYRSVSETALQAGNSENVLWESYLDLVEKGEAEAFWKIVPKKQQPRPLAAQRT